VARMPEFLAETYAAPGAPAPGPGELALAAAHAAGPGAAARFLAGIAVPEEETCFYLYYAPTAAVAAAALTAAGLRPERITPAIFIRPSDPARGAGDA